MIAHHDYALGCVCTTQALIGSKVIQLCVCLHVCHNVNLDSRLRLSAKISIRYIRSN